MEPLHLRLENEIRRLGRLGLPAAEVRRRLQPVAAELELPVPGYTAVLERVQAVRPVVVARSADPGVSRALLGGRAPTLDEAAATKARARVHKEELARRVELDLEERRWRRVRDAGS